jgi:D-alanyl-lipoteichoic acid acyltransferase DltB (MBOAT superfamily)
MIFNSLPFFVFVAVFFPLYFLLKGKARLLWCLAGSYFFYGWWDWRFLSLIVTSTFLDYWIGMKLQNTEDQPVRKKLLWVSVFVNLGFLAFFKYFNFFTDSFLEMANSFGWDPGWNTLNIILPVGISFYTFQSMSYTIDVYKKKIPVEADFLRFATFIAFFPQLVAGPIVRASDFLPQFQTDKKFEWDRLTTGLAQILWGFFKKVAIADSIAPFVDQCFASPDSFSSMHLLIGVVFYSFQIYCDFSGYSDIAIGLARIMGFDFPDNFKKPYFSQDFSEFWTRWHITLSSWLRDYLYISLGGNRHGDFKTQRNLMITMLLGGLWHGASWVFVFWGFLHGAYLIGQRLLGKPFGKLMRLFRTPKFLQVGINIFIVYILTSLAWIFFRSPDFETAVRVIQGIATFENFTFTSVINKFVVLKGLLLIAILLSVEIADEKAKFSEIVKVNPMFRVASFAVLLWLIAIFGAFDANSFIYFQF